MGAKSKWTKKIFGRKNLTNKYWNQVWPRD